MTANLLDAQHRIPDQLSDPSIAAGRRTARGWSIRRWPVRWLGVLTVGCALFSLVLVVMMNTHNPIYVPVLLLLGAAVLPATLTTLMTELEPSPRLTFAHVMMAAVLGGVLGGVLAGQLEFETFRTLGSLPYLMIGVIEESAKLAVPVLLFTWRRPRLRAAEGLALGVAVGSGFAAIETMGYAFVTLLASHGQLAPVDSLLLARSLNSLGGHAAWTGLACAAWFAMYAARRRWLARVRFLIVFATVVLLHTQWDAGVHGHGDFWVGLTGVGMLALTTLWLSWRSRAKQEHAGARR